MAEKRNMKIQVAVCPPADKVMIKNLRENVVDDEVTLYFEDPHECPCGLINVTNVKVYDGNAGNKSAVVQFQDSSDAEKVVKVAHPYLGDDVEVRLWNPLEDMDELKAMPAVHSSASAGVHATDTVVYHVKKQPSNPLCSLPVSNRSYDSRTLVSLEKKPSLENLQSQSDVQAVSARQMPSRSGLIADNKQLPIGCKKDGVFEAEVHLSPDLVQRFGPEHEQWLYDGLHRKMSKPCSLKMASSGSGRLAVVASSQDTADEAAEKLRACLLRGRVPLTDEQHKLVTSANFRTKLSEICAKKVIVVETHAREITIDGLPHHVVCAVSEIDQYLYN